MYSVLDNSYRVQVELSKEYVFSGFHTLGEL